VQRVPARDVVHFDAHLWSILVAADSPAGAISSGNSLICNKIANRGTGDHQAQE